MTTAAKTNAANAKRKAQHAPPAGIIRHVLWITVGQLISYEGDERRVVEFRKLKRLNTAKKIEIALVGLGFKVTERKKHKLVFEKSVRKEAAHV